MAGSACAKPQWTAKTQTKSATQVERFQNMQPPQSRPDFSKEKLGHLDC
jgi:hypothetical protein